MNLLTNHLERYATTRVWGFFTALGATWAGGSLVALRVCNRGRWTLPAVSGTYLWLDFCLVLACETLIAGLLFTGGKRLLRSKGTRLAYAGLALLLGSWIVLTAILFISLMSWTLCAFHFGFVTPSSLVSTILDLASILPFLSFLERLTVITTLCLSAAAAWVVAAKAPAISRHQLVALGTVFVAGLLAMSISFRVAPFRHLTKANALLLEGVVRARLLPTATLFWAPLILRDPYLDATTTTPLARRYDLNEYAARIDRKRQRPNILVFAIEALRGGEVHRTVNGRQVMPTVSRLAKEGVDFTRAYAQGNESLYSMTSVISGLHPLKSSKRDRFAKIDYPLMRIYDLPSPVYHTAFVSSSNENWQNMVNISRSPYLDYFLDAERYDGKALPPDRADSGFYDEVANGHLRTGTLDDATTTQQLHRWLREKLNEGKRRPFYATVSYQTSHYPYEQGFQVPALFTPNTFSEQERAAFSFVFYPQWATERMRNRYWNSLAYIDGHIDATLGLLKQRGALDNTIVVVHGDHGELFYENGRVTHAAELHDKTLHISFALWGARDVPRGEYRQPVSLLDLGPILLDVAGMPPHAGFQGSSPPGLRDLSRRSAAEIRPVFSSVQNITAFEDSVLVGTWKYVEQSDGPYANLYDLQADPLEQNNVYDRNPEVAECLRKTLKDFRRNQIGYYSNAALKAEYFPPRHELADVIACSVVFPQGTR